VVGWWSVVSGQWLISHWSVVTGNAIFNNQYSVCVCGCGCGCDHESVVRKRGQAIINFQYSIINGWGRMKDEEEEEGGNAVLESNLQTRGNAIFWRAQDYFPEI
jgi:hypothetical protein